MVELAEAASGRDATVAMVLKTAVARKTLLHIWKSNLHVISAEIRLIDAKKSFDASVPACVLFLQFAPHAVLPHCDVYSTLDAKSPFNRIAWDSSGLIADYDAHCQTRHLKGQGELWRSGIKHDCSKVMELKRVGDDIFNGLGETVVVEDDHLFPMFKSSQVAKGAVVTDRFMIVTQRKVGDPTRDIRFDTPLTWAYLSHHADRFDRRRSSIYRGKPKFSIFGVGDYSFAPWKVAISGFYENFKFRAIGPQENKPAVFDDTVYFLPCQGAAEASLITQMLNSDLAQRFFRAAIFFDAKRPVTTTLLRQLDLHRLAVDLNLHQELLEFRPQPNAETQALLFESNRQS